MVFGEKYNLCLAESEKSDMKDAKSLLFWTFMDSAPKTLGDLYESMLGAVFLDSSFSIDAVKQVMERTFFKPFWHRFESLINGADGLIPLHPVHQLFKIIYLGQCEALEMKYFF